MSEFIDYGDYDFRRIRNSNFVDKSGLLKILNRNMDTENSFMCISRPRRFGKSVAAKMAYAYYDRSSKSESLFEGLEITKSPDFKKHLNKYPTLYIDWNKFATYDHKTIVKDAQKRIVADLKRSYDFLQEQESLANALTEINIKTNDRFILIIDEWDMLVRDENIKTRDEYVNLLRALFKSNSANKLFQLVYMTGILPIIKYETQSALNNFDEFSVISPGPTAKYYGFTEAEVIRLCEENDMDFTLMKHAYDGYIIGGERSMFNPNSVMKAIRNRSYGSFWQKSASYTYIEPYIHINDETIRPKIEEMLNGGQVAIEVTSFRNDMNHIENADDVFTLLVHLGYLSYDPETYRVMIPNTEVKGEFRNTIAKAGWGWLSKALANSLTLLDKTIQLNTEYIASAFDTYRPMASSASTTTSQNPSTR